ncbi:MAG: OmpA family protein [Bacteroidales bacterium]|nr:OmpA family protein [Bacteroidales bacterium]
MKKIVLLLVGLFLEVSAQPVLETVKKLQEEKNYARAIEILRNYIDKKRTEKYDLQKTLCEIYVQLGDYALALEELQKANDVYMNDPNLLYMLGHVSLAMQRYEDAKNYVSKLLKDTIYGTTSKELIKDAKKLFQIILCIEQSNKQNKDVIIENLVDYNSEFSDYGIAIAGNRLYFSSLRRSPAEPRDPRTLQGYSKIYRAPLYVEDFEKLEGVRLPKISKVRQNEGCPSITRDRKTMYFTKTKPRGDFRIVRVDFKGDKITSREEITIPGIKTAGHPAIHPSGNMMIFVTEKKGNKTGKDLYLSFFDSQSGKWGKPERLPDGVNSKADELFPVWLNDSVLSFSSNRDDSYGGLDIYVTKFASGTWHPAVHLLSPINSAADDFNLIALHEMKGMFVSNRYGGKGSDDIYSYQGFPFKSYVKIGVFDSVTRKPIANAYILTQNTTLQTDSNGCAIVFPNYLDKLKLKIAAKGYHQKEDECIIQNENEKSFYPSQLEKKYYLRPNAEGNVLEGQVKDGKTQKPIRDQDVLLVNQQGYYDKTKTNSEGMFRFMNVKGGENYTLLLARKGYWTQAKQFSLPNLPYDTKFNEKSGFDFNFNLQPIETDEEYVIENIYYDFDKATLRPESKIELDKLVKLLKENPNLLVEINSHTDERGSHEYNIKLSQARAESVVNYLIEHGISSDRLIAKGYGKTRPVIPHARTEEEHQVNRRTSFRILNVQDITPEELLYLYTGGVNPRTQQKNLIYKVQLAVTPRPIENENYFSALKRKLPDLIIIEERHPDGFYHYIAGTFTSIEEAQKLRAQILKAGFTDCYILVFDGNQKLK